MLNDLWKQYPEAVKRIMNIVRSDILLTIEDYDILSNQKFSEQYSALDIYIEIKDFLENLKLARLAELITARPDLEKLVMIETFGDNNDLARFLMSRRSK